MERRRLGADGPEITVVGIGTAPIGSGREWVYWGGQDEREAIRAIRAGLDAGANWIDTAPFFGWGRAEELVRRALEGRRDDVFLFTKCGTVPDPERVSRMDKRPEAIRADLEASLLRLGVDHVDLLQIHDLDRSTPIEESWGELQRLREEGKIRWAGLSIHPAELVERAHAVAPVISCQESLSLLEGPRYPSVVDVVRRHGIGLLCWAPLASGFLVDGFRSRSSSWTTSAAPRRSQSVLTRSQRTRATPPRGAERFAATPSPGCSSSPVSRRQSSAPATPAREPSCRRSRRTRIWPVPDVLIIADRSVARAAPRGAAGGARCVLLCGGRREALGGRQLARVRSHRGARLGPGLTFEDAGIDELLKRKLDSYVLDQELYLGACKQLGIEAAVTPAGFPLGHGTICARTESS